MKPTELIPLISSENENGNGTEKARELIGSMGLAGLLVWQMPTTEDPAKFITLCICATLLAGLGLWSRHRLKQTRARETTDSAVTEKLEELMEYLRKARESESSAKKVAPPVPERDRGRPVNQAGGVVGLLMLAVVLCGACGTTGTREVVLGSVGGDLRIVTEGAYNYAPGRSVSVNGEGYVPVSGAPVPVRIGIDSPAMVSATTVRAATVEGSVEIIVRGSGNMNFASLEAVTSSVRSHTLMGDLASELSEGAEAEADIPAP